MVLTSEVTIAVRLPESLPDFSIWTLSIWPLSRCILAAAPSIWMTGDSSSLSRLNIDAHARISLSRSMILSSFQVAEACEGTASVP